MGIKFQAHSPVLMNGTPAHAGPAQPGRTMAPLSLTPLPAPASGAPVAKIAVSQDPGPAVDYSAYFAGHRDALLHRLSPMQAGPLSESQRSACIALLQTLAVAVDDSRVR
jgi:hypothetical protein